ncbi:helix-turn-helix transcriptional regulator [Klebsiella aerogenes]
MTFFFGVEMMKGYDVNKIHGEDVYFITGVSALIESLFHNVLLMSGQDETELQNFPDIWIFSRDSVDGLYPFIRQNVSHRPVIVFGKDNHKRLLHSVPGLEQMVFLNLDESLDRIGFRIEKVFLASRFGLPVNSVSVIHYPILTLFERSVLTGLMSGESVSGFAAHAGKSVNSISACKRRIMKKLNVFNNQELFARAWAMGIHFQSFPYNNNFER